MRIIKSTLFASLLTMTNCKKPSIPPAPKSYHLDISSYKFVITSNNKLDTAEVFIPNYGSFVEDITFMNRVFDSLSSHFEARASWCDFEDAIKKDSKYDSLLNTNVSMDRFIERCLNDYHITCDFPEPYIQGLTQKLFNFVYTARGYGDILPLTYDTYALTKCWWATENEARIDSIRRSSGKLKELLMYDYECVFKKQMGFFESIKDHPSLSPTYVHSIENDEWYLIAPSRGFEQSVLIKIELQSDESGKFSFTSTQINPPHPKELHAVL